MALNQPTDLLARCGVEFFAKEAQVLGVLLNRSSGFVVNLAKARANFYAIGSFFDGGDRKDGLEQPPSSVGAGGTWF